MTKIILVHPSQNSYENDARFIQVNKQTVTLDGRAVEKITYRNSHSLIWKIAQVALAVFLTLATLGMVFCFLNGMIWKKAVGLFKDRIVYVNTDSKLTLPHPLFNNPAEEVILESPIRKAKTAPMLSLVALPAQAPIALNSKVDPAIEKILSENPEYALAAEAWNKEGISLSDQATRLEELRKFAFGSNKWNKHFGEIHGEVKPLPADIYELLNRPDVYDAQKKVKDTHVLVLIPDAVMFNGELLDITLHNLGTLVKATKNGRRTQYNGSLSIPEDYLSARVKKSYWALMTKELLPNSKNQLIDDQLALIVQHATLANEPSYAIPNLIDVVACSFMHFINTGDRLLANDYSHCAEIEADFNLEVGGFSLKGLYPHNSHQRQAASTGVLAVLML